MKTLITFLLLSAGILTAQFKETNITPITIGDRLTNDSPSGLLLGFINPDNLSMSHEVSMSYTAGGGNGMALGTYTNTIMYKIANNLSFEVDASLVTTPYNTLGQSFTDQVNGLYLSRAQLNYKPTDNTEIMVQFRQMPAGTYYNPFYDRTGFFRR